ncbi:hypothetical protein GQ43DRAFT_459766 [Delitschia confertaspora ATCC 74209]|uniref:RING-type domain-containing protein n=1 Tax=Delitschia confertaspora ATCC 74209 TaxID=1513339 RepID=A0A9P4JYU0_9PLEO|nr:hypothetical protein GQ43DRAFT_459766 [Delitschia confertaspora ATCC 74209]
MGSDIGDFAYTQHGHKRTHGEMESEGTAPPSWGAIGHRPSSSESGSSSNPHPHISGLHLPPLRHTSTRPHRYPGDGMDYRRPITSTRTSGTHTPVIDLTDDEPGPAISNAARPPPGPSTSRAQRGPRYSREIIDLENPEPVYTSAHASTRGPPSPEVEFISARRLDPSQRQNVGLFGDIRGNDDEEVEIVGVHRIQQRLIQNLGEFEEMIHRDVARFNEQHAVEQQRRRIIANNGPIIPQRGGGQQRRRHHTHIHVGFRNFRVPGELDFEMVAFDLGVGREQPPPPPTYDAPSPAPEGFTRSPAEADVLVCPNCDDELCVGETDLKKQIWIIKQCGHVYCGDCAANRSKSRSKKGKEKVCNVKSTPFTHCMVDGCDKKASIRNAMIQVFL